MSISSTSLQNIERKSGCQASARGTWRAVPLKSNRVKPRCIIQYVSLMRSSLTYNGLCRSVGNSPPSAEPSDTLHSMEEFPMKILLATVALATLLSSSAHAQYGVARGYYGAYAQVQPYAASRSYGFNRAYVRSRAHRIALTAPRLHSYATPPRTRRSVHATFMAGTAGSGSARPFHAGARPGYSDRF
jgi:hypothetical protein